MALWFAYFEARNARGGARPGREVRARWQVRGAMVPGPLTEADEATQKARRRGLRGKDLITQRPYNSSYNSPFNQTREAIRQRKWPAGRKR